MFGAKDPETGLNWWDRIWFDIHRNRMKDETGFVKVRRPDPDHKGKFITGKVPYMQQREALKQEGWTLVE